MAKIKSKKGKKQNPNKKSEASDMEMSATQPMTKDMLDARQSNVGEKRKAPGPQYREGSDDFESSMADGAQEEELLTNDSDPTEIEELDNEIDNTGQKI